MNSQDSSFDSEEASLTDKLQYYKDRVQNLEAQLEYLESTLEQDDFRELKEIGHLLTSENFRKINNLVETMIRSSNRETIYAKLIEGIVEIFGFHRVSILERNGDRLEVVEGVGLPESYLENFTVEIADEPGKDQRSVLARSAARRESIVIEDRSDCPVYSQRDTEPGKEYSFQFLAIPLLAFDELIGLVTVARQNESEYYMTENTVKVLKFFVNQVGIALGNERLINRREASYKNAILSLAGAVEARDETTGDHIQRLFDLAEKIGSVLDLSGDQLSQLKWGAQLHDVGKIAINGQILTKPGSLTEAEYEHVKQHPEYGLDIIKPLDFLDAARDVVLYHHERWDGEGYPEGLAGEEIPYLARVMNLIDSWDVMIHSRPYKSAMTKPEAVAELLHCAGGQFDPDLVDKFLSTLSESVVQQGRELYSAES